MKYNYDKLVLIDDRDYGRYFEHMKIGDVKLSTNEYITKEEAINSNANIQLKSTINGINDTHTCGICNTEIPPIQNLKRFNQINKYLFSNINKFKIKKQKRRTKNNWNNTKDALISYSMVCCDGPRLDSSKSILCNQWYHKICIDVSEDFEFENEFFGEKCNHKFWYNNLNMETQNKVKSRLEMLRIKQK